MGGSTENGNITPYAEFNFYKDPDAAKIVFESDFNEIIMMGLNVTSKLVLNNKLETILKESDNPLANFLFEITRQGANFDRNCGFDGLLIHDPITISYLIDPSVLKLETAKIQIETEGEKMGQSSIRYTPISNCKVACDVDVEKFYKLIFKRILNIDI